jgi:hypothetical protein
METKERQIWRTRITISLIIGIVLGTFLFPMIIIPLISAAVVIGALYLLIKMIVDSRSRWF